VGLHPRHPNWRAYSAPQTPQLDFRGFLASGGRKGGERGGRAGINLLNGCLKNLAAL